MLKCGICDSNPENKFFTLRVCQHVFCHKCLHNYINSNLDTTVKCPLNSCQKNVPDQVIRKCLSNGKTNCYEMLSMMSSSAKLVKCLTKNCQYFISVEGDVIFHCEFCDQPNCTSCKKRHNITKSCNDVLDEKAIDFNASENLKSQRKKYLDSLCQVDGFVENPEGFDCILCAKFILPREGVMLRNCYHFVCRECLEDYCKTSHFYGVMTCFQCGADIDDRDVIKSIGEVKLKDKIRQYAAPKFYFCKSPDCYGLWDPSSCKNKFRCPLCNRENCLDCEDVHVGKSCEEFRKSPSYKEAMEAKNKMKGIKHINCRCGKILIYVGGCGAIRCDNCNLRICRFTGRIAGNYRPESCGCTPRKPCHEDCLYGCIPE